MRQRAGEHIDLGPCEERAAWAGVQEAVEVDHFDGVEVEQSDPLDPDPGECPSDKHANTSRADDPDMEAS